MANPVTELKRQVEELARRLEAVEQKVGVYRPVEYHEEPAPGQTEEVEKAGPRSMQVGE